jgi:hypothetical protein
LVAPLTISSNVPGYAQDAISLKRYTNSTSAQRWELSTGLMPTNDSADLFVMKVVNNFTKKFYIRMPQVHGISLTPVGSKSKLKPALALAANYLAGTNILSVEGLGFYDLAVGEFVQFAGDNKVYIIVEAGVKGENFKIFPSLRTGKIVGTEMLYGNKVTLHCYMSPDKRAGISFVDGILADPGSVDFVEAL